MIRALFAPERNRALESTENLVIYFEFKVHLSKYLQ